MKYNILLTTSGGGNAQNVVRSLKQSKLNCHIIGVNADKFELTKSNADTNYILPRFDHSDYLSSVLTIVKREKIDFIIPNHEFEIKRLIDSGSTEILDKCFLPRSYVVDLCVNKFDLINFLESKHIHNIPKSYMFNESLNDLPFPIWVRLIRGAGSQGATLVYDREELEFWVKYWVKHKNVSKKDFMISEYLPGKDHHHFSIWKNGEMIVGKVIERLRYCCSKYTLTGTSSSPSLCKAVLRPDLDILTEKIIKTIDENAQGLYGIDYKANVYGVDCITEINIGRFPRINYIFNLGSLPNIAELYVRCGLGHSILKQKVVLPSKDLYFIRDFDTPPILKKLEDIESFKKI